MIEYRDDEQVECGTRKPVGIPDPRLPSAEEVREHALTHLPYRAWCPHCVRWKGKSLEHRRLRGEERGMREVHVDYCFLGRAGDERPKCIVVGKDRETKMVMCSVVPFKGASHEFLAKRIRAFIKELGFEHLDVLM